MVQSEAIAEDGIEVNSDRTVFGCVEWAPWCSRSSHQNRDNSTFAIIPEFSE
jgi:hypothetical protein